MGYDELMDAVKAAILTKYPDVNADHLESIYNNRMMEYQRVLMQYTDADILYSVTINMLENTTSVKVYEAVVE